MRSRSRSRDKTWSSAAGSMRKCAILLDRASFVEPQSNRMLLISVRRSDRTWSEKLRSGISPERCSFPIACVANSSIISSGSRRGLAPSLITSSVTTISERPSRIGASSPDACAIGIGRSLVMSTMDRSEALPHLRKLRRLGPTVVRVLVFEDSRTLRMVIVGYCFTMASILDIIWLTSRQCVASTVSVACPRRREPPALCSHK